jgi:hypothetical protein
MVSGPASNPRPANSFRIRTISSTVVPAIARGDRLGRRERGTNAASPSTRYRASSSYSHDRDTPIRGSDLGR